MAIPKVMGTEIEYGITVENDRDFDPIASCVLLVNAYREDHDARILWDYDQENPLADARGFQVDGEKYTPNQQENIARNKTLVNGARYYVDHAHPEYSCPEVTNPRDLVIHEKAGEHIVELSRRAASAMLPHGKQLLIHKNNSDRKGSSYGSHENYLMDRRTSFKRITEQLIPFFVSRQLFCGAGKVGSENRGQPCDYQLSQRADFFETEVALDTMVKRPIINTRDEPHADREKYRRLHVIVGDSNMSEYTNFLKVGACAVVLQMIEDNYINKDFTLRNPVKAIKDISYDTSCKRKLRLDNGKEYSPIEIQLEYCQMAQRYVEHYPVSDDLMEAVGMWQYVLDRLQQNPDDLDRKIDWIIKRKRIHNWTESRGVRWDDPRVFMLDLQYHDIRLNRGLFYLLERRGAVDRILNDEEVLKAKTEPPPNTRARMRGEFIKLARQNGIQYDLDWSNIRLGNLLNVRVMCNNPFETDTQKVEELVRTIQRSSPGRARISKLVIQS